MSKKKPGDVYRQAAMVVNYAPSVHGYPSCSAIMHVMDAPQWPRSEQCEEARRYAALFKPNFAEPSSSKWGDQWGDTDEERKECRVLALLFMAEIADSEGGA